MLREMMKPRNKGRVIEINLSKWGYKNYSVECAYRFDESKGKYLLSMWLNHNDMENRMKLSSNKIDSQYISGTNDTIVENICRIVHQAATVADENGKKYFDDFIYRYEYELSCFECGNKLFENKGNHNN